MARWLPSLLTSALALSVAPAAPALKDKGPVYYWPATVGHRWVLKTGAREETYVISRAEQHDGALVVDVAIVRDDREQPAQQMRLSADGVFRLSVAGQARATPELLLKLPHKDGQKWEFDLGGGHGGPSTLSAVRREQVETPAGRFDAIRVEREGGHAATYWFVAGVGLVKVAYSGGEQVLKSYSPARK
jgi:hypothetical protein